MKTYENTTALVTGASSGIGLQLSLDLAKRGARPVLVARREERLNELAARIKKESDIEVVVIPCDLTAPDAAEKLFEQTTGKGLQIDILVNNAGFGFQGKFTAKPSSFYRDMTTLNMTVLTELTSLYLPGMQERGSGGIMNIASMAGIGPVPYFAVYAATKSYVNSFSCALWHELKGSGVHVTSICPGPVETEFFKVAEARSEDAPIRKIQKPEEVSEVALNALLKNKMLVPTSLPLKLLKNFSACIPTKASLSVAAAMMPKK